MSELFSSPGKQAEQGASAVQGIDQSEINQGEAYYGQQEQAERNAIAATGSNPYFSAASSLSAPAPVTPSSATQFGTTGVAGTTQAAPTATTPSNSATRRNVT